MQQGKGRSNKRGQMFNQKTTLKNTNTPMRVVKESYGEPPKGDTETTYVINHPHLSHEVDKYIVCMKVLW
jgi:hypothetical protein